MAENSVIISSEEEAKLLKPIDEYVEEIQKKIDALRADGFDKVSDLKKQIAIAKENKNLSATQRDKIIENSKKELENAKKVEADNKEEIKKLIAEAESYLEDMMQRRDSCGGVVECVIKGLPAGVGEPVFDKLDAALGKAVMSIGAVKGFEIGDGFEAAASLGSRNNDSFIIGKDGKPQKVTNHSGGTLGGMSDGSTVVMRAAFKPTPSISQVQKTVDRYGKEQEIQIKGRHDPVIVPRAVVVVEAMAALTAADLLLMSMTSRLDRIKKFFNKEEI